MQLRSSVDGLQVTTLAPAFELLTAVSHLSYLFVNHDLVPFLNCHGCFSAITNCPLLTTIEADFFSPFQELAVLFVTSNVNNDAHD